MRIIGIAGASGSGKSELAREVAEALGGASILTLDCYYRELGHLTLEERALVNFDDPAALEAELIFRHVRSLRGGIAVDEPEYSFEHHTRTGRTTRIVPTDPVIVEGLFTLHWPELRELLDLKVFVETRPEVCYARRLERDVQHRGRTPESVYTQYETTVRPSAEKFVYPSARFADLTVSGERPLTLSRQAVLDALLSAGFARQPVENAMMSV